MARVTVLMPVYNVAPYVDEAIQSVLQQSYTDFELLVIDDHSTDATVDHVRAIHDPRLRLECNPHNLGLADNLNRGLDLVNTELVARMDGDDIAHPDWLEKEVAYLDEHPDVGVCGAGGQRFGTSHSLIRLPEEHADICVGLLFRCSVLIPTMRMSVVRRHHLRYSSEAFPAEDYRFWVDASAVTQLHNLPEPLFHYRMHPTQICSSRQEVQQQRVNEVRGLMLGRLGTQVTQVDIDYYVNAFFHQPTSKQQWMEHCHFADRLLSINDSRGYYNEQALSSTLHGRLWQQVYDLVLNLYFERGYSPKAYLRYLCSGLVGKVGMRHECRFLLKSILFRKA